MVVKYPPIVGEDGKTRLHPYNRAAWVNHPCRPPGSNSKLRQERRDRGMCEMSAATCSGEVRECPDCGYRYCEYHWPYHINYRYKP